MVKCFNTFWIAGTPRVGSMLTFNLTREVLMTKQLTVRPDRALKDGNECLQIFQNEALHDDRQHVIYVFKVHQTLKPNIPRSKFIINKRNPFDICASFYEFMKCDLDRAIEVAQSHILTIEHYKTFGKNTVLFVEYEEIENNISLVIQNIAYFLEQEINNVMVEEIGKKYSKEAVHKIISELHKKHSKNIGDQTLNPEEIVNLGGDKYRMFDTQTGFQTGHISNRNSGEWTKVFNEEQISLIERKITPFAQELGYC